MMVNDGKQREMIINDKKRLVWLDNLVLKFIINKAIVHLIWSLSLL